MSKIIRRGWERLSDVALFVLSAALPASGQRDSARFRWIVHQKRLERSVHRDAGAIGIVNPTHFPELIHEEIHPRPRGADNRGQCVLIDFLQDGWCLTPLAVLPKPKQGAGQPLFAGIKNVAQQVFFDMPVTFEQMLDELGCYGRLFLY